jgi:hypothetical protein
MIEPRGRLYTHGFELKNDRRLVETNESVWGLSANHGWGMDTWEVWCVEFRPQSLIRVEASIPDYEFKVWEKLN